MKSVRPPAYSILASLYEGVENVSSNFDSDVNKFYYMLRLLLFHGYFLSS